MQRWNLLVCGSIPPPASNKDMIYLIINADDLGLNPTVNAEINNALKNHYISSSTILANSNYWNEIHTVVDGNPQASFGVHLNLTQGRALTDSPIFRKLNIVDDNNYFTMKIRETKVFSNDLLEAVYNEWNAQVNKVINIEGIRASHFDGHHHIHAVYAFRGILLKLLNKYGIDKTRNRYNIPMRSPKKLLVNCVGALTSIFPAYTVVDRVQNRSKAFKVIYSYIENAEWQNYFKNNNIKVTHYFDAYEHQVEQINAGILIPNGVFFELMCHPGHPNYAKEYEMIKNNSINLGIVDIELISYNDYDKR